MKPEIENLKEYTSKLTLTTEERLDMFQNIRAYSDKNPIQSKYTILLFKHSLAYMIIFVLLIGTSATSIAAEDSIPGDILYPVKTNVNEAVVKTLSFSKAQKAKVAVNLIDKRMGELEEMVITEKNTPEKMNVIVTKLEEHKKDVEDFIKNAESTNKEGTEESIEISDTLKSVVDTHVDILENITKNKKGEIVFIDDNTKEIIATTTSTFISTSSTDINSDEKSSTLNSIKNNIDTVSKIAEFSSEIDSIIPSATSSLSKEDEKTIQTKANTRKKILENAENELQIETKDIQQEN